MKLVRKYFQALKYVTKDRKVLGFIFKEKPIVWIVFNLQ